MMRVAEPWTSPNINHHPELSWQAPAWATTPDERARLDSIRRLLASKAASDDR